MAIDSIRTGVWLSQVQIPRCYFGEKELEPSTIQLHGFSDASRQAYAAAVYLRSEWDDGRVQVELVASKTKEGPFEEAVHSSFGVAGNNHPCQVNEHCSNIASVRNQDLLLDWLHHRPLLDHQKKVLERVCPTQSSRNPTAVAKEILEILFGSWKPRRPTIKRP